MRNLNQVILGDVRLVDDAKVDYLPSGMAKTNFKVALNDDFYHKKEQKNVSRAYFFKVVVWGKMGESLVQYLTKGRAIDITGKITMESYNRKSDGQRVEFTVIVANDIILKAKPKNAKGSGDNDNTEDPIKADMESDLSEDGVPF